METPCEESLEKTGLMLPQVPQAGFVWCHSCGNTTALGCRNHSFNQFDVYWFNRSHLKMFQIESFQMFSCLLDLQKCWSSLKSTIPTFDSCQAQLSPVSPDSGPLSSRQKNSEGLVVFSLSWGNRTLNVEIVFVGYPWRWRFCKKIHRFLFAIFCLLGKLVSITQNCCFKFPARFFSRNPTCEGEKPTTPVIPAMKRPTSPWRMWPQHRCPLN